MKMLRSAGIALLAGLAGLALATSAWAIQPGTDGTNKQSQTQQVRVGGLACVVRTATASAGAATINPATNSPASCGAVTTESLTTLPGSDYTLTLTNTLIEATDEVLATVDNGTNTGGAPFIRTITPAAGSVVIVVRNGQSGVDTAIAGTLKIKFFVIKQSALGSD